MVSAKSHKEALIALILGAVCCVCMFFKATAVAGFVISCFGTILASKAQLDGNCETIRKVAQVLSLVGMVFCANNV